VHTAYTYGNTTLKPINVYNSYVLIIFKLKKKKNQKTALRRMRQKDLKFETSLGYTESSRPEKLHNETLS
jgi:predicted transglutaminase-like protease